jgi:predicted ATPase
MSEKMVHISSAHIEGYKSILNADVEFMPGLNVIIGKNGAGKSNLLNVLEGLLLEKRGVLGTSKVEAHLYSATGTEVEFVSKFENENVQIRTTNKNALRFANSNGISGAVIGNDTLQLDAHSSAELISIPHSTPKGIPFLDRRLDITINRFTLEIEQLWNILVDPSIPYFARVMAAELFWSLRTDFSNLGLGNTEEEVLFNWAEKVINEMIAQIRELTPVTNVRMGQGVSSRESSPTGPITLMNVSFEFKLGGEWLEFDKLSDGTKRIIFVLFSILSPRGAYPTLNGIQYYPLNTKPTAIIFLEEPELGIHPHQLHLLLLFLKEQAKTQQIILTTHSPQVLDILDKDELDRIIIADYHSEKGSQFHHLTEAQKEKALAYMTDMLLSDYWRFSDLEPHSIK